MAACDCYCETLNFCNSMVCELRKQKLRFIEAKFPTRSFYMMNRQEFEERFGCLSKENCAIYSYCNQSDCFTCQHFHYIKNEFHKAGYFLARECKYQPITWEIHEIFY